MANSKKDNAIYKKFESWLIPPENSNLKKNIKIFEYITFVVKVLTDVKYISLSETLLILFKFYPHLGQIQFSMHNMFSIIVIMLLFLNKSV